MGCVVWTAKRAKMRAGRPNLTQKLKSEVTPAYASCGLHIRTNENFSQSSRFSSGKSCEAVERRCVCPHMESDRKYEQINFVASEGLPLSVAARILARQARCL